MAITSSAKKAQRASLKKHVFNVRSKRALIDTVKVARKAASGVAADAKAALSSAYQAIDKAAKRGIIKKNTASRKKSRLSSAMKRDATKA